MSPTIIRLDRLNIVGMQTFGTAVNGDPAEMWDVLRSNEIDIPNRVDPAVAYGVETYTQEMQNRGRWFYMAGVEVADLNEVPVQMCAKQLPANEYAVFEYKGAISPALGDLFQHIYKEWLPASEYLQAYPYDLERYDARFKGPMDDTSVMEIMVPVILKS